MPHKRPNERIRFYGDNPQLTRTLGSVALSTRVRLARNLADEHFPNWANDSALECIFGTVSRAVREAISELRRPYETHTYSVADIYDSAPSLLKTLAMRHVISQALFDRKKPSGVVTEVVYGDNDFLSVMINEEDHIRIQSLVPGYDLTGALQLASRLDDAIGSKLTYAFDKQLGYLTACPSNIGTGMRASVMLALPGLLARDEFDPVCRALERLGFSVRGVNGEETEVATPVIQISNRGTLGRSETQVIAGLGHVVEEVILQEFRARLFYGEDKLLAYDYVSRNLAVLQSAYFITAAEAFNALVALRFGRELGFVRGISVQEIGALFEIVSDEAVSSQRSAEPEITEETSESDEKQRAEVLRKRTKKASLSIV